jgi:hypothetical protein
MNNELCYDIMEMIGEIVLDRRQYDTCLNDIENVGEEYEIHEVSDPDIFNCDVDAPFPAQFFCSLFHNDALTETVQKYRMNRLRTW